MRWSGKPKQIKEAVLSDLKRSENPQAGHLSDLRDRDDVRSFVSIGSGDEVSMNAPPDEKLVVTASSEFLIDSNSQRSRVGIRFYRRCPESP